MVIARPRSKIGAQDHGRRMSLGDFEFAEVEGGCVAELARGYVVVGEVPNYSHAMQIVEIVKRFWAHEAGAPGSIHAILEGSSTKLVIPAWESERHPDIAVYLTAPKGKKDRTLWRRWIPDIAIEVVSESSDDRDYTEKRDEYWTLGVKEYWIVDARRRQIVTLRRGRSEWIETRNGPEDVVTTKLLAGFALPCDPIFAAVEDEI